MPTKQWTVPNYRFGTQGCFKRNYKLLKYFTISVTDLSHVNKIKCCLEEPFQRVGNRRLRHVKKLSVTLSWLLQVFLHHWLLVTIQFRRRRMSVDEPILWALGVRQEQAIHSEEAFPWCTIYPGVSNCRTKEVLKCATRENFYHSNSGNIWQA